MKNELKNLRSVLDQTVFQENHFTEANRQIVKTQIQIIKEKPQRKPMPLIRKLRPTLISIGSAAVCILLFVMFQDIIQEQNLPPGEGNSAHSQGEFPGSSSNQGTKGTEASSVINLPESVIEQVAYELNKSKSAVTAADLPNIISLEINEPFDYATVLSQFENLEELAVCIPVEDWSFLQDIPGLTSLRIANNELTDLTFLPATLNLTYLAVENIQLKSLEGIQRFTGLQTLSIIHNDITNLTPIQELTGLTILYAHDNEITSLEPLQNLTNIEILTIGENPLQDFSTLGNLTNLQILSVSDTELETLDDLKDLNELLRLDLRGTAVSDLSPLADKEQLYFIDIRNTEVRSIEPLLGMDNLKFLLLDKDRVLDWTLLEDKEHVEISEHDILAQ